MLYVLAVLLTSCKKDELNSTSCNLTQITLNHSNSNQVNNYFYDSDGKLTISESSSGRLEYSYLFNSFNQLIRHKVTNQDNLLIEYVRYEYAASGNLLNRITYFSADTTEPAVKYRYANYQNGKPMERWMSGFNGHGVESIIAKDIMTYDQRGNEIYNQHYEFDSWDTTQLTLIQEQWTRFDTFTNPIKGEIWLTNTDYNTNNALSRRLNTYDNGILTQTHFDSVSYEYNSYGYPILKYVIENDTLTGDVMEYIYDC